MTNAKYFGGKEGREGAWQELKEAFQRIFEENSE